MRGLGFLLFVALTVVCWGIYGPVLHEGQHAMGADGKLSSLRPYICVGAAYFLIAVIVPIAILATKGEKGSWTLGGFVWSLGAGGIGALGALGIILAFKFQGKPTYVMPLVFGFAPVVNTFCTMFFSRTFKEASALFYTGVAIVAIGAAGVLVLKPKEVVKDNHAAPPAAATPAQAENSEPKESSGDNSQATESQPQESNSTSSESPSSPPADAQTAPASTTANEPQQPAPTTLQKLEQKAVNWLAIGLSIALTALCWGAYGPVLHKGQMKMGQSRLRPFLCVGLAYFVIAVVAAYFMLQRFPEPGGWNAGGVLWSLAGGAAGAFGALGIIYAFNFGGKPIFVMPLVFGLAPVVNTFTEISTKGLQGQVTGPFYLSLAVTILGAVMVLVCAPKGHAKPPAPEAART